ncbi:MAG: transposase, partial [Campylobacterota bacterium]|nr:transposase [Campylobacterota bacterium]
FLALDKDAQWSYQQDLKRRLDYKAVLDYAKEEAELKGMEKGMERGIEKGMKQGIEQGIEKGIKQGQKQEKIQIAKNLLDVLDDDTLSQKTGLSVDEIAKLRD